MNLVSKRSTASLDTMLGTVTTLLWIDVFYVFQFVAVLLGLIETVVCWTDSTQLHCQNSILPQSTTPQRVICTELVHRWFTTSFARIVKCSARALTRSSASSCHSSSTLSQHWAS